MGDQLGFWEKVTAIDVIGVMMGIDHVANALRAPPKSKVTDLPGLLGERCCVNYHGPFRRGNNSRTHFGIELADEHVDVFGDPFP
jgi:hypothetical protein